MRGSAREIKGFLLAAGAGERAKPLTLERPKPLLPTLDTPQLQWNMKSLVQSGITDICVNVHDRVDEIFAAASDAAASTGANLEISHETPEPLGTAGALLKMSDWLGQTFLVMNSDVACSVPLDKLIASHVHSGAEATLVAIPSDYACDLVVEQGWVIEMIDRRERARPGWIYAGIGVFERSVLKHIPRGETGLYDSVFVPLMNARAGIAALDWEGYWRDVGSPRAHLEVNLDALSGNFPLVGTDQQRNFVGPDAETEGAELRNSVIGSGAKLRAGSTLNRCVVWGGAEVKRGEYIDCVITPRRVVKTS